MIIIKTRPFLSYVVHLKGFSPQDICYFCALLFGALCNNLNVGTTF
jgi:hypothetical protein